MVKKWSHRRNIDRLIIVGSASQRPLIGYFPDIGSGAFCPTSSAVKNTLRVCYFLWVCCTKRVLRLLTEQVSGEVCFTGSVRSLGSPRTTSSASFHRHKLLRLNYFKNIMFVPLNRNQWNDVDERWQKNSRLRYIAEFRQLVFVRQDLVEDTASSLQHF